jgi:uncharacterized membrane protein YjjB (DUF3815 family)
VKLPEQALLLLLLQLPQQLLLHVQLLPGLMPMLPGVRCLRALLQVLLVQLLLLQ